MEWSKKVLLVGGTAAAALAVLWYLRKAKSPSLAEDDSQSKDDKTASKKPVQSEEAAKERLKEILREMIKSQEQMKAVIKDLTKELREKSVSLLDICQKIEKIAPEDPIAKHGLQMMDFDKLLEKHQQDSEIRNAIAKIMGAPNPQNVASEKIQAISVKEVIDYHKFMLQELEHLIDEYENLPAGREGLDPKTVTIAAQVIVGARFESEFQVSSEDVESAVLMYHANLATDQTFAQVNVKIQHAMSRLMGTKMTPS